MHENCEKIKAVAENTTGTPTQKLIAVLMAVGVTSTKDLAAIIGINERAIRKAKAEPQDRSHRTAGTTGPVPQDREAELQDRQSGTPEPGCARESKNKLNYPYKNPHHLDAARVAAGRDFDDCKSAFNGSTDAMLDEVDRCMGGNARREAAQWLANLLRSHGAQAVKESFQSLLTAKAEQQPIAHPLRYWSKIANTAKAKIDAKPAAGTYDMTGGAPFKLSPDTPKNLKPRLSSPMERARA